MSSNKRNADSWLNTPIRSRLGTLSLAGELENNPGIDPLSMRILGKYALVLILGGSGFYRDNRNTSTDIKPGDAVLVFPEIAHAYGPRKNGCWKHAYIVFEGSQFDLLRQTGVLDPNHPIWRLQPVAFWKQRLKELVQAEPGANQPSSLKSIAQFSYLLADMAATHFETRQHSDDTRIDESSTLLSEPFEGTWLSPQLVAQKLGISYESFRKRFAKRLGESPAHFQKRRRIEHACAAIYQNALTFQQLADQLGFCDVFHFSKAFRQITGEPPSVYRKRALGEQPNTNSQKE